MSVSWEAKVRTASLEHLYRLDRVPEGEVPPHALWQAPFVFAPTDEPWDRLVERIRAAGQWWLLNQDFRPYNELVIAHVERPWFMAFQRGEEPDERDVCIGPFDLRVLRATEARPVWPGLPLIYRETAHSTARELFRELARRSSLPRL
jgi:hypothetical protein